MRKVVDLPQPEGPTSTTNSPSATSMLTPSTAVSAPNVLRNSLIESEAIGSDSYLTAPAARPATSRRCTSRKPMNTGTMEMSDAAIR